MGNPVSGKFKTGQAKKKKKEEEEEEERKEIAYNFYKVSCYWIIHFHTRIILTTNSS